MAENGETNSREAIPYATLGFKVTGDQAGLSLIEIHLPLPLECWDETCVLSCLTFGFFLIFY